MYTSNKTGLWPEDGKHEPHAVERLAIIVHKEIERDRTDEKNV